MQLARLRFHLHTRTLAGKFRQILYAIELERHYSKNEILEAYLNEIYLGQRGALAIRGVGAAVVRMSSMRSSGGPRPDRPCAR